MLLTYYTAQYLSVTTKYQTNQMTVWYLPHFILSATCLPVNRRQNALWGACMTTWTYWSTMTVMASCMNIRPLMTWNQTFVESLMMTINHRSNLGSIRKLKMLLIFQMCCWPSQIIGEVYNFKFSLVRNTGMVAKQWNYWSSGILETYSDMKTRLKEDPHYLKSVTGDNSA